MSMTIVSYLLPMYILFGLAIDNHIHNMVMFRQLGMTVEEKYVILKLFDANNLKMKKKREREID